MANEVSQRAAPQLPGLATAADAARIVSTIQVENDGTTVRLSRFPAPDERRALQQRNAALVSLLRPSRMAQAEEATAIGLLGMMFKGYTSLRKADIPDLIQTYLERLREFPIGAIKAACDAVANNQIPGLSMDFPPASPRLVKIAQDYVSRLAAEKMAVERILLARTLMRPNVSAAEAARIADRLTEFAALMKATTDARTMLTPEEKEAVGERRRADAQRAALAEYRAAGIEPVYGLGGVQSLALARSMGVPLVKVSPDHQEVPLAAYGDNLGDRVRD